MAISSLVSHDPRKKGNQLSKSLSANSQLLQRYWFNILKDAGNHKAIADDIVGMPAKVTFVKELPSKSLLALKKIKVAPSKWMTFHQAGSAWDPTLSARALVLGSLVMSKAWVVTAEDLFAPTRLGASSCGEKPDINSKAAGLKDATLKLDALKKRQQNNMTTAARLFRMHGWVPLLHLRSQKSYFPTAMHKLIW